MRKHHGCAAIILSKMTANGEATVFQLKCKDASMLMAHSQDESLPWCKRVQLRAHLMMCHRCRGFNRQMQTLSQGVRKWKEQSD